MWHQALPGLGSALASLPLLDVPLTASTRTLGPTSAHVVRPTGEFDTPMPSTGGRARVRGWRPTQRATRGAAALHQRSAAAVLAPSARLGTARQRRPGHRRGRTTVSSAAMRHPWRSPSKSRSVVASAPRACAWALGRRRHKEGIYGQRPLDRSTRPEPDTCIGGSGAVRGRCPRGGGAAAPRRVWIPGRLLLDPRLPLVRRLP